MATGPILVARYDLLPAVLVLASVWAFVKGKVKLAWAVAALGFAAKLYPIIIIPFFVIYQFRNREYGRIIKGGLVFLLTLLILFLPWIIIDAGGFWHSFTYHMERGLHSESVYGTALLPGQLMGLPSVQGELTYGSWNLSSPLADSLAKLSFPILAAALLAVYAVYAWRLYKNSPSSATSRMSEPAAINLFQYVTLEVACAAVEQGFFRAVLPGSAPAAIAPGGRKMRCRYCSHRGCLPGTSTPTTTYRSNGSKRRRCWR